jgi:hypothetical protein
MRVLRRSVPVTFATFWLVVICVPWVGVSPVAAQVEPSVVVTPSTDLFDSQLVEVERSGFTQPGFHALGQCRGAASPVPNPTSNCRLIGTSSVPPPPSTTVEVLGAFGSYDGTSFIDCRSEPEGCIIAATTFVSVTDLTVVETASAPISFGPRPSISVSPDSDVIDGETIEVTVGNLAPERQYNVAICSDAFSCRPGEEFVTTADGTGTATLTAVQRFLPEQGSRIICRDNCSVRVHDAQTFREVAFASLTMAVGAVGLDPSTGLVDGQDVSLSGSRLQPTYDGQPLGPFGTGHWATAQCEAAVGDSPSLYEVFVHCGFTEGLSEVTVPGSELPPTELPVFATMTKILGGETDCAAAPGSCVFGLFRLEDDGLVTAYHVPLTFGTG